MNFGLFIAAFGLGSAFGAALAYKIWLPEIRRGYDSLMAETIRPATAVIATPAEEQIRVNRLTVTLNDGSNVWVQFGPWSCDEVVPPWRAFFKWLHGRSSPFFNLPFKGGFYTLRRDLIARVDTRIMEGPKRTLWID